MDPKNEADKVDEAFNYIGLDPKEATINKNKKKPTMGPSTKHKSTLGVGNKSGPGTPGANGATTRNDNSITLNDISPINHLTSVN